MSDIRQRLQSVKDEAADFFAHVGSLHPAHRSVALRNCLTPADWQGSDAIREKLAAVMTDICDLIKKAPLLGPTSLSSHQKNTRRMVSALSFRCYECWGNRVEYNEDTPIARIEAGEADYDIGVAEAESIFLEALRKTIELLELAEPQAAAKPPIGHDREELAAEGASVTNAELYRRPGGSGTRGPKTDLDTALRVQEIVLRLSNGESWKDKLPEICEALDGAKIRFPKGWPDRGLDSWADAAASEPELAKKAIAHYRSNAQKLSPKLSQTLSDSPEFTKPQ